MKLSEIAAMLDASNTPYEYVRAAAQPTATPEGYDEALESFLTGVEKIIHHHAKVLGYKDMESNKVIHESGIKYDKVFRKDATSKNIYCFIERSTGNILKPATFKVPAKGARGNLFDETNGLKRMSTFGPEYNK